MKFIQTDKNRLTDEQFNQVSKLKHFLSKGDSKLTDELKRIFKIIYPYNSEVESAYDGDHYRIDNAGIRDTTDPDRITVNCTLYHRPKDAFSQILSWPADYLISEEEWKFLIDQNIVELDSSTLDSYYSL